MYRGGYDMDDYRERLASAEADLYQGAGTMPLSALESLCRRISTYKLKLGIFKGSKDGNKK